MKTIYDNKNATVQQIEECPQCKETARITRNYYENTSMCRNCGKNFPLLPAYSKKEVLTK